MKTIFRYTNVALLMAAFIALGAVTGLSQNPCEDADGMTALNAKFTDNYNKPAIADRKIAVEAGKQYIEKYGTCPPAAEFVEYLKKYLPGIEKKIAVDDANAATAALYTRFNDAVKASNWDETYAAGKEILAKEPEQLDVIISLGSIGYDESYKGNFKYNDDTLRFAKMAIAALESGKTSKDFGLFQWRYKSKDNALGWLNFTIGYITQVAQKNKKDAMPYLYKATQLNSETNKNPIPYELVGSYYFDELNKLTQEIKVMVQNQPPATAPEADIKAAVDAIKAKVALSNGTSERALDAYPRAYTLGVAKPYKDKMYKNLHDAYNLRFAKTDGLDTWIAETVKKPFINPLTPVTPISDPEPAEVKTTGDAATGVGAPNGTGVGGAKPAATATKPAATPAKTTAVKKP